MQHPYGPALPGIVNSEVQNRIHEIIVAGYRVEVLQYPTGFFRSADSLIAEIGFIVLVVRGVQLSFAFLVLEPYGLGSLHDKTCNPILRRGSSYSLLNFLAKSLSMT
jgi:hypothetical protein